MLAATFALGSVARAHACDACLEDKIAATYDWQVVSTAQRLGHTVVFTKLLGPITPRDEALARTIVRRLGTIAGVDVGTVRVSLAPPAVSFACNPACMATPRLIATINRKLRPTGLALAIVRIGAPGRTAPARAQVSAARAR
jgi:hypothetical protein